MTPGMLLSVEHLLKGFSEGDMLSVHKVSLRLGVSSRHVRRLLTSQQLRGMKVGDIWRIPFTNYREYVLQIAQQLNVQGR